MGFTVLNNILFKEKSYVRILFTGTKFLKDPEIWRDIDVYIPVFGNIIDVMPYRSKKGLVTTENVKFTKM